MATWLVTSLDVAAAICLISGSVLTFAAGLGMLRFPDLLARMHTAAKPQVLGVMVMLIGLGLRLRTGHIVWMLVLVALFQMLTSPVAAHMVSRAGYRTGKVRHELLVVDELTRDLEAARAGVPLDEPGEAPRSRSGPPDHMPDSERLPDDPVR